MRGHLSGASGTAAPVKGSRNRNPRQEQEMPPQGGRIESVPEKETKSLEPLGEQTGKSGQDSLKE